MFVIQEEEKQLRHLQEHRVCQKTIAPLFLVFKSKHVSIIAMNCFLAAKHARLDETNSHLVKGIDKKQQFIVANGKTGFEDVDPFEAIKVSSNLPENRQALAMSARKFFKEEVLIQNRRGTFLMPTTYNIALTNNTNSDDVKWVTVKFAVNFMADSSVIIVGDEPVKVSVQLRKGSAETSNRTSLALTFAEYEAVVTHARAFIETWRGLDKAEPFESLASVPIPDDVVLRVTDKTDKTPRKVVLFTVNLLRKTNVASDPNIGTPVVHIREYVEDVKKNKFVATHRGVGFGMHALYMLVFPCSKMIRKWHDSFLNLCITEDSMIQEAELQVDELLPIEKTGAWNPNPDSTGGDDDDELSKDERSVLRLEQGLQDVVTTDDDFVDDDVIGDDDLNVSIE